MELINYLKSYGQGVEFATQINITPEYLSLIKNGKKTPSPPLALKIQEATGGAVTVMELLFPVKTGRGETIDRA